MAISRPDLAVPLLVQAPPGQLSNVYDDLYGLVASDEPASGSDDVEQFTRKADVAREEHNVEQLIVVELPDGKGASLLSKSNIHIGAPDRFISPRHKLSFKVDHATLTTSDPRPYKENAHVEPLRSKLESLLGSYLEDRYASGVVEVIAVSLPRKKIEVSDEVMQDAKVVDVAAPTDENEEEGEEPADGATVESAKRDETDETADDNEVQEDDPVQAVEDAEAVEKDIEITEGETGATEEETAEADTAQTAERDMETTDSIDEAAPTQTEEATATPTAATADEEDIETEGGTDLIIHIVANQYKLSNFWSGRWRSTYRIAQACTEGEKEKAIDATSKVHVHYFEEGNVQLHANKAQQLSLPASSSASTESYAKAIVKAIRDFDETYQQELFKQCSDLSEGAFRALRRQLPMTRQKIDWDKVLNYKLGTELSKQ